MAKKNPTVWVVLGKNKAGQRFLVGEHADKREAERHRQNAHWTGPGTDFTVVKMFSYEVDQYRR